MKLVVWRTGSRLLHLLGLTCRINHTEKQNNHSMPLHGVDVVYIQDILVICVLITQGGGYMHVNG